MYKIPIDDEAVGLFGKVEAVAKLDFRVRLAANEDMGIGFVKAENLVGVGNAAFANDAFVRLVDGLWELVENALNLLKHDLSLKVAPVGFYPIFFEQDVVVAGVAFDHLHEPLHAAEYFFARLFSILTFAGLGHFDAELIHFVDELFGRADAVPETLLTNLDDGSYEGARGVAQQHPVDGEMDVGFYAGGVGEDFVEAQGGFAVEQLACGHFVGGCAGEIVNDRGEFVLGKYLLEPLQRTLGYGAHAIDEGGVGKPLEEQAIGDLPRKLAE